MTPEECPNCGAEVPPRSRSCPECGADETTGWNDDATAQRLGIPTEGFDYEAFVEEEFGKPRRTGLAWYWKVTGAVLLLSLLLGFLRWGWR